MEFMKNNRRLRFIFAVRCFIAVWVSYVIAEAVGLPFPAWAPVSAIVVSQEQLEETRTFLIRRVIGTICGVFISVALNALATPCGMGIAAQAACSVAICALLVHKYPSFRTSMVTAPIVLLTAAPTDPMYMVGLYRGSEVMIGSLAGGGLHILSQGLLASRNKASRAQSAIGQKASETE